MKRLSLFIFFLLTISTILHGLIWSEGFSGYANHTGLINVGGVATPNGDYPLADGKWTLDTSDAPNFDVFYTTSVVGIGDILRAEETGGVGDEVVFRSEIIDISDYYMVHCTVLYGLSEYVSTVTGEDYIKAFYKLDGGAEQPFSDGNGVINGPVTHFNDHAEQNNLCGNSIQIIIKISADSNGDLYDINRITIDAYSTTPSYHVTDLTGEENYEADEIQIDCVDDQEAPETEADGYLLKASTGVIANPVNGIAPVEDNDLTDGDAEVVMIGGAIFHHVYYFGNYSETTTYHFKVFPFTNSTCHGYIYKTDGAVPTCDATTNPNPVAPNLLDLVINEIHPNDLTMPTPMNGYIEIYNRRAWEIDLSDVYVDYYDDSPVPTASLTLFGKIMPHGYAVICQDYSMFTMSYPDAVPNFEAPKDGIDVSLFPLDGGFDIVTLNINFKASRVDSFNDPATPWAWDNTKDYERTNSDVEGTNQVDWTDAGDGLPGEDDDPPLPVVLSSFTAIQTSEDFAKLTWITQSETNLSGYNIYRNINEDINDALCLNSDIIPAENTNMEQTYSFIDETIEFNIPYYYWIESVAYSGTATIYEPIAITFSDNNHEAPPVAVNNVGINSIYPNPFNPSSTISYFVRNKSKVTIDIYNMKGQKIYRIDEGVKEGNRSYSTTWNGIDMNGKNVPSGIYLFKFAGENITQIRKAVLIK